MKIGIPRALMAYQYPILYETFFKQLGIEVVYSEDTNTKIIQEGIHYSIDENCLASKIYVGHVLNLVKRRDTEQIDYIFIPRISFFNKRETVCVKFYAMYDICHTLFPDTKFIDLNIDYPKGKTELMAFLTLGKKLGFSYGAVVSSYLKARNRQYIYDRQRYHKQCRALETSHAKTVLIVSHPYIVYDHYLGGAILQYLTEHGIHICYADSNKYTLHKRLLVKKEVGYKTISSSLYWKDSQDLLNGMAEYLDQIDGIIYLSTFPCGPDALVNELAIRKIKDKPSINIILDEQEAGEGLHTRLESFIDILTSEVQKVSGD